MADLTKWDVEDNAFWDSTGKRVANRNLYISIPSLLCGFAVWLYCGHRRRHFCAGRRRMW